ncbi:hypothetical protein [Actinokineospora sp. NBRC 105648]|uniref:hypothetical protein n=1 Tax=Actinokineospora sp. NBRC 105648 TaxID=3032206 RepID=UPI0024A4F338|nr:hypothetical protein [Actinokineospora sp. NBRC 105648]GLZ41340.1 hypothetical protein Acsp05_49640 [Actinokineospora sp. NBRC 105648]
MEWLNTGIRALITLALVGVVMWCLILVSNQLFAGAFTDSAGNTVDPHQRAKDLLLVVMPLVTTVLGFWFGTRDQDRVRASAAVQVEQAENRAAAAIDKLTTVTAVSTEPDLLPRARTLRPDLFAPNS